MADVTKCVNFGVD